MTARVFTVLCMATLLSAVATAEDGSVDPARDILVTFSNDRVRVIGAGVSEPYRKRKQYSIDAEARRHAADIADEYALREVDRWPIRSLEVFCVVYRVSTGSDRDKIVGQLLTDPRVESAQPVQQFQTLASPVTDYDDTYAGLQRGLDVMEIPAAHLYSRGQGVRVAIVDSYADADHEDLKGRVRETQLIAGSNKSGNGAHGTAVASVIGANANNATGIVGIAPEATIELYVACWAEDGADNAVCDSFTLAKALDTLLDRVPDILNLSLTGPDDPLLERLLNEVASAGVVIVAARPAQANGENSFPASLDRVIGVGSSDGLAAGPRNARAESRLLRELFAPGDQIMVAVPDDGYDFRSGNSLSAAHVSGVIALLLAVSPNMPFETVRRYLQDSQQISATGTPSVNACVLLQLLGQSTGCQDRVSRAIRTEEASRSTRPVLSHARRY